MMNRTDQVMIQSPSASPVQTLVENLRAHEVSIADYLERDTVAAMRDELDARCTRRCCAGVKIAKPRHVELTVDGSVYPIPMEPSGQILIKVWLLQAFADLDLLLVQRHFCDQLHPIFTAAVNGALSIFRCIDDEISHSLLPH